MIRLTLSILLGFVFSAGHAESWTAVSAGSGGLDSKSIHSTSIYQSWLTSLDFAPRLKIGGGARFTYIGKSGDLDVGPTQTWNVTNFSSGAINAMFNAEAAVTDKIVAGMNIDVFGLSFGGRTTLRSASAVESAKTRTTNLLLIGKRDRGTLNSEFYLSYPLPGGQRVSAGLSHQVIEFESKATSEKLQRFYDLGFVRFQF